MSELEPRASDAEREQTVATLRDASAECRLTLEELADRTALAYRARTHADLETLTADLPVAAGTATPAQAKRRAWLFSIFAPVTRSRRRRLAADTVVVSLFAPTRLDLRSVSFPPGEASITVISAFAPVFVTVPEHIDVETSVFAVFAPVQEGSTGDVPPGAPRLHVRGLSLFGPVFVQVRRS
jgi:uncharacterized protein DUF1707